MRHSVVSLKDAGTIGPRIRSLDISVSALGMNRVISVPGALKKLTSHAAAINPDIIQGWMYHGNLMATLARRFSAPNTALIWGVRHTLYDHADEKPMTRLVIRTGAKLSQSPQLIVYNSDIARETHEAFGFCPLRSEIIPNGVDLNKYRYSKSLRTNVRSELKIPEDATVIGHVARYHPVKDHPVFLRACKEVSSTRPDVHFVLAGRGVTEDNPTLQKFIPGELKSRLHLLGRAA